MDNILLLLILMFFMFEESKDDPFDRKNTHALKGICAVAIVFRHLLDYSNDLVSGKLFNNGFLFVAVFFLISGYGYGLSLNQNVKSFAFLLNRLVKIIVPFGIVATLRTILYIGFDFNYDFKNIKLGTYVPYSWYVYAIIFFYIAYFFVCFIDKPEYRVLLFGSLLIIYIFICVFLLNNVGISWYMAVGALWMGTILGEFPQIKASILKYRNVAILSCAAGYLFFIRYYDCYDIGSCILQNITVIFFALLIVLISSKINIVNKFTDRLGGISYEIYLLQGLTLQMIYRYMDIGSKTIMIGVVILLNVLMAYCVNVIDQKLIKDIIRKLKLS